VGQREPAREIRRRGRALQQRLEPGVARRRVAARVEQARIDRLEVQAIADEDVVGEAAKREQGEIAQRRLGGWQCRQPQLRIRLDQCVDARQGAVRPRRWRQRAQRRGRDDRGRAPARRWAQGFIARSSIRYSSGS
jgi:hypothetical protein